MDPDEILKLKPSNKKILKTKLDLYRNGKR